MHGLRWHSICSPPRSARRDCNDTVSFQQCRSQTRGFGTAPQGRARNALSMSAGTSRSAGSTVKCESSFPHAGGAPHAPPLRKGGEGLLSSRQRGKLILALKLGVPSRSRGSPDSLKLLPIYITASYSTPACPMPPYYRNFLQGVFNFWEKSPYEGRGHTV
jgi:hypothetical protein